MKKFLTILILSLGINMFGGGGEANALGILYTVDSTGDGGNVGPSTICDDGTGQCTLRAAIEAANAHIGADGIDIVVTGTINLTSSLPNITESLDIYGPGADFLTVSGGGGWRIFNVTGPGAVNNLIGLTISNGNSGEGSGIYNASTLNVANCTIISNLARDGGGIYNTGSMNVTNCTIISNSALDYGGGIYNSGTLNVANCRISSNSTQRVGLNRGDGGGIYNSGSMNVTNCTLSSNSVLADGGGIFSSGTVNLTNSTITGNRAVVGGGVVNSGIGGIFSVKSSIIALNTAASPTNPQDVYRTFVSQGFNLIGKTDGSGSFTASTDLTGTAASPLDPKLDPSGLQDNGGPTDTIALLCDSPAIDKGTSEGLTGTLTTDQRDAGFPRTIDDPLTPNASGGDGTDIGAFESHVCKPTVVINSSVTFVPLSSTFKTVTNTSGCPAGFVGKYSFDARLTNISNSQLRALQVKVVTLSKGNLLQNADGGPGGIGAVMTVPVQNGYSDGVLSKSEFVDIPFIICLKQKTKFSFFVDVLGIEE